MAENTEDLAVGQPPALGEDTAALPAQDSLAVDESTLGSGTESQIAEGVATYMQTQDPQIAVQVVELLAQEMGITGEAPAEDLSGGAPAVDAGPPAGGLGEQPVIAKQGAKLKKSALTKYIESQ